MFEQAHHFSIHGSHFIYQDQGNGPNRTQVVQNKIITYEQIELATPPLPTIFTGRDILVTEAAQKLCQEEPAHLAILGTGGIGKTALALHIINNETVKVKFKNRTYFAPCELCTDAPSIIQILLQTLKLSVPEGRSGYEILDTFFRSSSEPILLVLDNFETPWNLASDQVTVQNLIEHIWDQKNLSMILTMRAADGPGNRNWVKLGGESGLPPLKLEKAREAFMLISSSEKEDIEQLDWLLNELDCIPLAILLVAQLRKRQLKLKVISESWKEHKTKMLKIGLRENRLTSLTISIDLSLQILGSQNMQSIKMLPILSFLPSGILSWEEQLHKLIPKIEITAVTALLDTALVYQANGSLRMLAPIREYVQTRFPAKMQHLNQMGKYYVALMNNAGLNNQDIVELHIVNVTKVFGIQLQSITRKEYLEAAYLLFEYTKFFTMTISLADIVLMQEWEGGKGEETRMRFVKEYMLYWMGNFKEAKKELAKIKSLWTTQPKLLDSKEQRGIGKGFQILRRVKKVAKNMKIFRVKQTSNSIAMSHKEQQINAQCLQSMSNIARMEGRYSEAKRMLAEAKSVFETVGDQLAAAQCLRTMGNIARVENKYSEARIMLSRAKSVFETMENKLGIAQCLRSMGNIARMEDKYPEAKTMLAEARLAYETIGNQLGAAQCMQSMGDVAQMENKYPEAKRMLAKAKSAFETIGDRVGAAQCLKSVGNIARMENKYSEVKTMLVEAKLAFEMIGDQLGAAQCLQSLGNIARMEDRYSEAKAILVEVKLAFEMIGNALGAAQCLQSMGNIAQMEHKYLEAKIMLAEAKSAFETIGNQLGAAQCLQSMGDIAQMEEQYVKAKTMLEEAMSIFETIGNQLGATQCLRSMGDIAQMKGKYLEAETIFADAMSKFETIGNPLGAAQCQQSIANIAQLQNKYSEAKTMLSQAKLEFDRIGSQLGAAQCLKSMANIAQVENNYSEAKTMLSEAKSAFETAGDQLGAAQCLRSLGNVAQMENNYSEAKTLLAEAMSAFEMIGNQLGAAQCLQNLTVLSQSKMTTM